MLNMSVHINHLLFSLLQITGETPDPEIIKNFFLILDCDETIAKISLACLVGVC